MCARRFLIFVFVMILLAVAATFAFFQWGGNILLKQATPKGHFDAAAAGGAPDYSKLDAWLARPGLAEDPSQWLPGGIAASGVHDAAVFYIHPTTYLHTDKWNAPLHVDRVTESRTRLFVQSQASAFNGVRQIWAPRYRQAAYGAFLLKSADAQHALELAYGDVSRAFEEFLRQAGGGPIILAAHSQGSLHLERLLRDKIAGTPIARRIVAAYVVGWPVSTEADLPELGLPPCRAPDQTGCILSWMSFGDPANPDIIFQEWEKTKGFNGRERRQVNALCVNPISGIQDGAARPQDNPGTLIPAAGLRSATLNSGRVGARCADGLLIIDGDIPAFTPPPMLGNNFHVYDYALFWGAIRRDAMIRLAAWRP